MWEVASRNRLRAAWFPHSQSENGAPKLVQDQTEVRSVDALESRSGTGTGLGRIWN